MSADSTAKFAALAIGAYLIVEAALGASRQLGRAELISGYNLATTLSAFLVAVLFAWILWRYTSRANWESESPNNVDLLRVGIKLLAAYLLVTGIPDVLGMAAATTFAIVTADSGPSHFIGLLSAALVKVFFGIVLIRRTEYVVDQVVSGHLTCG
ncbi:MAG: hypothetical protein U5O39_19910 [Gammaproteobacteria bacterium]|nr:hypothetical protein [Gammaproteobacteria bacterium]